MNLWCGSMPYHNHHDIITVGDGLILKGEVLIISLLEKEKILQAIHGQQKMQVSHKTMWTLAGYNDIRCMVRACPTCKHHRTEEPRQPLQPTPAPECHWCWLLIWWIWILSHCLFSRVTGHLVMQSTQEGVRTAKANIPGPSRRQLTHYTSCQSMNTGAAGKWLGFKDIKTLPGLPV